MSDLLINNQILEFTVSQISALIKNELEETFGTIKVIGEVSGLKVHTSGHSYFALKDANAVIDVICWRGNKYGELLEEGIELVCHGRITSYPGRSKYQMIMEICSPVGNGLLFKLFNERKEKLTKEGLTLRKRALPHIPQAIALITSETGAALQDFLQRMQSRIPCKIFLFPALMQGKDAEKSLLKALAKIADFPEIEVIIFARGGGSVEDLWCFNDENLARAVFAAPIPTISAIGHETDFTLIDFVSDLRAPTPTAAAEIVIPAKAWLLQNLNHFSYNFFNLCLQNIQANKLKSSRIKFPSPLQAIEWRLQRIDEIFDKMQHTILWRLSIWTKELTQNKLLKVNLDLLFLKVTKVSLTLNLKNYLTQKTLLLEKFANLEAFNLNNILKRGFVLVRNSNDELIKSAQKADNTMILQWFDGQKKVTTLN